MLFFDNPHRYPDDSEEQFIIENLSPYCIIWLSRQSEALGQTKTVILQQMLKEWFATHVEDVPDNADAYLPEIAREAVAEFILRHQVEFLPIGSTN
jgi:hypothetical protein